jgi:HPt (histidine-containing phosphotransfer) domain-containing protein
VPLATAPEIGREAHAIRGSALTLTFNALAEILREIELGMKRDAENAPAQPELATRLVSEWRAVAHTIAGELSATADAPPEP